MIKIIIFDQDGTFYNPKHKLTIELRKKTKKWISNSLKINKKDVEKIYEKLPKKYPNPLEGFSSIGLLSKDYLEEIFNKTDLNNYLKKDFQLIDVLKKIKQDKYVVTIASFSYSLKLQKILGIKKFIKKTYSLGEKYPQYKSKFEIYELIRKLSGLSKKEILIVGDNYKVDLMDAHNQGYNVLIVWNGSNKKGLVNLKNIYELPNIIKIF